ncbi:MAG: hypothetical protein U1D30_03220 [Planctomycetota bacterium]
MPGCRGVDWGDYPFGVLATGHAFIRHAPCHFLGRPVSPLYILVMSIGYYITAHGYGHAVRSLAVINAIPADVPVTIVTRVPASFLKEELKRPATIRAESFDCGAVQHDALRVDPRRTLESYAAIHERNQARIDDEVAFVQSQGIQVLAFDAPSFAARVAEKAGIPSVLVSNFSWSDIYADYVQEHPPFRPLLDAMKEEYAAATGALRLPFALPMPDIRQQREGELVCRPCRDLREEIAAHHQVDIEARWVLLYVGQGESGFDWRRLERSDTVFFLLGQDPPMGSRVVSADAARFGGQNLIASCDMVMAKPGYGIVADCVASGTPLVYTPRHDFAEFLPLHEGLSEWGLGLCVAADSFFRGPLDPIFDQVNGLELRRSWGTCGAIRWRICFFHSRKIDSCFLLPSRGSRSAIQHYCRSKK